MNDRLLDAAHPAPDPVHRMVSADLRCGVDGETWPCSTARASAPAPVAPEGPTTCPHGYFGGYLCPTCDDAAPVAQDSPDPLREAIESLPRFTCQYGDHVVDDLVRLDAVRAAIEGDAITVNPDGTVNENVER